MAFTYLALNIGFLLWAVFLFVKEWKRPSQSWFIALFALLTLTLIFDNVAIWADFFHYTPELISGIMLGLAPIEDFFYPLVAMIIVPALWKLFGNAKKRGADNARNT